MRWDHFYYNGTMVVSGIAARLRMASGDALGMLEDFLSHALGSSSPRIPLDLHTCYPSRWEDMGKKSIIL